jgi:spore photoproduct lyase
MKFTEKRGKWVKHCPCTPGAVSCGYFNLNLHTGCPYNCTYCILQAYLENPEPVFFTNWADLEAELAEVVPTLSDLRLGTGELSDSLALDPQTGYAQQLLRLMEKFPAVVFEFKTKSAHIDALLRFDRVLPNIVVSWSLNPQPLADREEKGTASLAERLGALSRVLARGYKIGIHFDPLILCPDWRPLYHDLIGQIAGRVKPGQVAWWSLGALRFPANLRPHILKHRDSGLFYGELIRGYDDKYRYFKPLRLELFHFVINEIKTRLSGEIPLYLCMEDQETWEELFPGLSPRQADVNRRLYRSVLKL